MRTTLDTQENSGDVRAMRELSRRRSALLDRRWPTDLPIGKLVPESEVRIKTLGANCLIYRDCMPWNYSTHIRLRTLEQRVYKRGHRRPLRENNQRP